MRTVKIDFTAPELLPDGKDLGFIGEHNATELVIIPPEEMTACEDIATYIVAFATNGEVIYSDSYLKTAEITVPLTARLTRDYYLAVQLEGYDSLGGLVVKSPLVTMLQLAPSARGTGTETDGGSISGSAPSVGSGHSHENKQILDSLGISGSSLTFNGKAVGGAVLGSKYYTNDWSDGTVVSDIFTSGSVIFLISEDMPENRIITDISVLWRENDVDTEYTLLALKINAFINDSATITVGRKPEFFEDLDMYAVASISSIITSDSKFYSSISMSEGHVIGFTVHYLEV